MVLLLSKDFKRHSISGFGFLSKKGKDILDEKYQVHFLV